MLPVYDPKSFASIDLRKYHIRTIKDAIRFLEFTTSRMDEALFVLKKFNTQFATFKNVSQQLQQRLQAEQNNYGAGMHQNMAEVEGEIQTVEEPDNTVDEEREALLDEVRQAVAEETLAPAENEDPSARFQAEFEKYLAVKGKTKRIFFYRQNDEGKRVMVSEKDVPEDIKQLLLEQLDKQGE